MIHHVRIVISHLRSAQGKVCTNPLKQPLVERFGNGGVERRNRGRNDRQWLYL